MHIMIDLETMGTRPDAPIISIGAVAFDANGPLDSFYAGVNLGSSVNSGAKIDASTVLWWMQQSDEARAALVPKDDDYSLVGALTALSNWVTWDTVAGVWGNGASVDNVILRESYYRTTVPCPWPFWKDRCYRTIKGMHPGVELVRNGTHHNALDDARTQALHLMAINTAAGGIVL